MDRMRSICELRTACDGSYLFIYLLFRDEREKESLKLLLELIPDLRGFLKIASANAITELAASVR